MTACETFEKLSSYTEMSDLTKLRPGDHFRYTSKVFQGAPDERKLCYGVVQNINADGSYMVNGYGEKMYADWRVDPKNRFKDYRFYKKDVPLYTGSCQLCDKAVKAPYTKCYTCVRA